MKKYKDGKMVEMTNDESERIQKIFKNSRFMRSYSNNYEVRIKVLEETVAEILAKLNEEKSE